MSTRAACIICHEGATGSRTLVSNPAMLKELLDCCKERVALGQNDLQIITDRLENLSETDRASAYYHSECRKPIVNKTEIDRLRAKRTDFNSPGCSQRGPGRPSAEVGSRPKRTKTTQKAIACMFA
ncbi:hypothetical protein GWK47_048378 [Chionoecetes opilio]|uniref:Uncharacterized protein n=1 Tax=Chionoecetes opilio TaxID=41210 RepID=A0A8J5CSA7_CHIOP|nr:hypothetical protein GWK47_048378 [Chionoecetes opilio]